MTRTLLAVMLLFFCACWPGRTPPKAGAPCDLASARQCISLTSVGICDQVTEGAGSTSEGVWFEAPCADWCSDSTDLRRCTLARPRAGDPCPQSAPPRGACASDTVLLVCVDGRHQVSDQECPKCRMGDEGLSRPTPYVTCF